MTLSDDALALVHAALKIAGTWGGVAFAVITSHALVFALASVLTSIQIWVLVRDKILKHREPHRRGAWK